jgi:hypothetical protein
VDTVTSFDGTQVPAFAPAVQGGQPQGKGGSSMGAPMPQDMRSAVNSSTQQGSPPIDMLDRGQYSHVMPDRGQYSQKPMNMPSVGKGNGVASSFQGEQPRMGMPNNYSNTVGQWDNSSIQPARMKSGKGKGA